MPTFGFGCSLLRFIPCGLMRASRGVPSIHYFFIVIPPDCKLECGLMQTGEDHFLGRNIRRFLQCELGARSFSLHLRALNMAGFCSCFCTLLGSKIAKLVYISNSSASCQLYTTMLKWGYSWGAALRMCLKVLKHIETYWNAFWLSYRCISGRVLRFLPLMKLVSKWKAMIAFLWAMTGSKDSSLLNARPQRCLGICP